jgi:hypothetical protein
MTNDLKRLVPAQEKLEWVTPKISLMEAGDTEGRKNDFNSEVNNQDWGPS